MKTRFFIIIALFLSLSGQIFADENFNSTPYSTIYTHMHYLQNNEYNPAISAKSFDIKDPKQAEKYAVQLKQILDGKGIFTKIDDIPNNPDYQDTVRHKPIYILNSKLPEIYLEKKGELWFYSDETVNAIPKLYKVVYPFGSAIWVKLLPYKSGQTFLKLHYWQWLGIACIIGIFLAAFFLCRLLSYFIIKKIAEHKITRPFDDLSLLKLIANTFSLVVAFFIIKLFLPTLLLSPKLSASLTKAVGLISGITLILFLYKLVELLMRYAEELAKHTPSQLDDQLVRVLKRFLKLAILAFGLFYILSILDVNITTVIAGISIGGLAFALAAQDTVKNFIGSLMIFADSPFKIGDTITGENFTGVVQEVGFRSTRIKTDNDSVVTVANGKLADMTIDNKGQKMFKKFKADISISYDTPLFKVERFIEGIKTLLLKYPYTKDATIDVFLTKIEASGMTIMISYTYKVVNQREEYQHREILLLQILRLADILQIKLFEQQKVQVQNPSTTTPENENSVEDVDHKLDSFFIALNSKVPPKTK